MAAVAITVGDFEAGVAELEGRIALSEPFRFRALVRAQSELPGIADLLGQAAALRLEDPFERTLSIHGLVTEVERDAGAAGAGALALTVEPVIAPLCIDRDCRVFHDLDVVAIVKEVLERGGVDASAARWATTGSYPKRPYCAQYRESSWDFVERLLAEEGIYYWFELREGATTLVFADDSTAAPDLDGGAEIPFADAAGLRAARDCVTWVERRCALAVQGVRLRDHAFAKPRLRLEATAGSGPLERHDFPGRFDMPATGDRLARVRLEALRAQRAVTRGTTASTRLRTGHVLELVDHPLPLLNGRHLVTAVSYRWSGEGDRPPLAWEAIPADTPYRRALDRPLTAAPGGPQIGVVVGPAGGEIHSDRTGRVRVQLFWDREGARDERASTWMRVGQIPLGGSMIIPRVGWETLVGFHEGDADRPAVLSHLYDGEHPVPYPLPANKTRTAWQTATTPGGGSANEIRFEDAAGAEEIFINASKDMNVVVGDNKGETIGVNHAHQVGSNLERKIGDNLKLGVTSNQDVSIGGSESLTVSGKRVVSIQGSDTESVGGSRSVTVSGGSDLEATGGRSLSVGGSQMAASALGVNRTVLGSLDASIGGAWINAAALGVADVTGGAGALTVGGAKIDMGATGCKTAVRGALAETVGGAYVINAGKNVGESAEGALSVTVGGAFLGNAPEIQIEADSKISIRCGGATLTITPSSVEVKAPTLASPGATIKKKASKIEHN